MDGGIAFVDDDRVQQELAEYRQAIRESSNCAFPNDNSAAGSRRRASRRPIIRSSRFNPHENRYRDAPHDLRRVRRLCPFARKVDGDYSITWRPTISSADQPTPVMDSGLNGNRRPPTAES
jgi:hypothetical protein